MAILKFTTSLLGSAAVLLCYAAGNRTTPPTLNVVAPLGIARGTTVEMTVEGLNLARRVPELLAGFVERIEGLLGAGWQEVRAGGESSNE